MSPDVWSTIAIGIAILIAIAASNRSMRREIGDLRGEMGDLRGEIGGLRREMGGLRGEIGDLRREMGELRKEMIDRIDAVRRELSERIDGLRRELSGRIDGVQRDLSDVRERLGQIEGPPEGAGPKRPRRTSMERGDDMQSPTPPRP